MKDTKELIKSYVVDYENKLHELIDRHEEEIESRENEKSEVKKEITIDEAVNYICECGWIIQHNMEVAKMVRNELWDYIRMVTRNCNGIELSSELKEIYKDCNNLSDIINIYSAEEFMAEYAQYVAGGDIAIGDEVVNGEGIKGSVIFVSSEKVKVLVSSNNKIAVVEWNKDDVKKTGEHSSDIEEVMSNNNSEPIERLSEDDAEIVID